ncbi:hypothetical protein FOZ63_032586, partial [Perkinsus olseni]
HTRNYAPVIAAVEASRGDRTIADRGRSGDQGLMPSWATMGHSSSCSGEKASIAGKDPSTGKIELDVEVPDIEGSHQFHISPGAEPIAVTRSRQSAVGDGQVTSDHRYQPVYAAATACLDP